MNLPETSVAANKKYQELIEVPNAVIFDLSLDKKYTSLNTEWTHLTTYSIKESWGTSFLDYVTYDTVPILENQFQALIQGPDDGLHREVTIVTKQEKMEKVHLFLKVNKNQQGEVESFSGTLTNLSSREKTIESYKKDIRNYRLISENMNDMVAVLAQDGLVLYASPSHTTTLGLEVDQYVGSYPIKHIHPDDWERIFHLFHKMVETWSTLDIEYRCMHKDGLGWIWK